jgi:sugar O-acyltransferase (sialic acid O-acetyltransferase NeuD family)
MAQRPKILIVGASGHAKVIIDIVEHQGTYEIAGLIDSFREPDMRLMGYTVIGSENAIPALLTDASLIGGIVAIGHNWTRHNMVRRIRVLAPAFAFCNAIHPSARVGREVSIGCGVAIMAGVSVNPGTHLGDFSFLNTNSSVDHDNILGEFSCLQPNAATGGNVKIGAFSAVSMGANVIHGITIGSHTVVGAGSTVLSDIPDRVVAYGSPCRVVRRREPEDSYY